MKVNYNHKLLSSARQKFSEACAHAGSVILRMTALGEAVRGKNVALALTVFSGMAYSQTTYTFNYTGSTQTISLQAGSYSVEAWGGDGGGTTGTNVNAAVVKVGGKGGYAKGTLTISAATTASIYVGGKGNTEGVNVAGGFNGGGNSGAGVPVSGVCGSGGGASDIRIGGNAFTDRKIVAGGGGAAGYQECNGLANAISGGHGGGTIGGDPVVGSYAARIGHGGTQTAGGTGGTDATYAAGNSGSFGLGANGGTASATSGNGAGGGGGWYGGGSGSNGFYCAGGGGGGSSYIGGVTNGTTIMYAQPGFVSNPDVTGNGRVLITELCSITLMASTANSLNPAICSGQSLTITTNAISNYSWSTGATTSSLVVSPTTNTVYSLTAMSPSNCTTSSSMSVSVSGGVPLLSVSSSTNNICLGKTVILTASGALSYTWTNPGVVNGQTFAPTSTQTYTVIGQNGCGTVTAFTSVTVAPLQVSAISSPTIVCAGSPSTLSAVSAATSYTWYPNSPSTASTVVAPTVATIYTVTATDGTCSGVTTVSLAVNPIPTISIVASSSAVCAGNPATLIASGGINYTWTPVLPSVSTVTVYPSGPTLYSVIGDNSVSCTSSANQVIVTDPSPTVNITPSNTFICLGTALTLVASGSATSYVWVNGPSSANYPVNPISTIIYTVVGTGGSGNACTTAKTATVNVFSPILTIAASPSSTVCSGTSVTLTASGTDDFNWVNGPPLPENNVTPNSTTIYTVSGNTATLNLFCSTTKTIQITVNPNPTVTATSTRTDICKGEAAILNAGGALSFGWSSGDITAIASVTPSTFGVFTYSVTGTDANNCKNMATILVKVNNCSGLEQVSDIGLQLSVYPNPANGEFTIEFDEKTIGSEITLNLVNEFGQQVRSVILNLSNNYKATISDLPAGIYIVTGQNGKQALNQKIVIQE